MNINPENYTRFYKGNQIESATLRDDGGMEAIVCGFGARLISLSVPDGKGEPRDVLLGYPDLEGYISDAPEMGAIVGRFANRIAKGRFKLGGKIYKLERNDGDNHLHGGLGGSMRKVFGLYQDKPDEVSFKARLVDGEDGYPGNLDLLVTYALPGEGRLRISISAVSDKPTPANFCNHAYFNLSGDSTIADHELAIRASRYTPVGMDLIPTGEVARVAGTPLDFTKAALIGERIDSDHRQLANALGYDHNFVLDLDSHANKYGEKLAARLFSPSSSISMEVWTKEPGLQFYSGNFLGRGKRPGRRPLTRRAGLCLETQRFPDSPNKPQFPDAILRPGQRLATSTSFVFGNGV